MTAYLSDLGNILIQRNSHHTRCEATIDIDMRRLGHRVDAMKFKDGRLLLRSQHNNGEACATVIDVADILQVAKKFTVEQADLYTSLYGLYQVFQAQRHVDRARYSDRVRLVTLSKAQEAIWKTIPEKLRARFVANTKQLMRIRPPAPVVRKSHSRGAL